MNVTDAVVPQSRSVRSAVRGGMVYAAVSAAQRGLSFLLLPLYAYALGPAAYGDLSLVVTVVGAAVVVMSMGLEAAVFRQLFVLEEPLRGQFITTAGVFLTVFPLALAVAVGVPVLYLTDGVAGLSPGVLLGACIGAAVYVSATVVPFAVLRAHERLREFAAVNAVLGVSTALFTVLLVVIVEQGVEGWVLASVAAAIVTYLYGLRVVGWHHAGAPRWSLLLPAFALGLPLVPHLLSNWGLQLADRAVLAGIVDKSALGVYALASSLSLPVLVLVTALNQGTMPSYARAARDPEARRTLARLSTLQIGAVLWIGLAVGLIGPCVIRLLMPAAFAEAAELLPWLSLAWVLAGLYFPPMNVVSLTVGRTTWVWVLTLTGLTVNLSLIYALVPRQGLLSAAQASVVGYATVLVGLGVLSHRVAPGMIPYQWRRIATMGAVATGAFVLTALATGDDSWPEAVLRSGAVVAAGGAVALVAGRHSTKDRPCDSPTSP